MKKNWTIQTVSQGDRQAATDILDLLIEYNVPHFGPKPPVHDVRLEARDDKGKLVGGLLGQIRVWWLHVDILVCTDEYRKSGLGSALMEQAEARAREVDCQGIWLDTFDFQAPGFYERIGFTRCGTIQNFYNGQDRHIYEKRL